MNAKTVLFMLLLVTPGLTVLAAPAQKTTSGKEAASTKKSPAIKESPAVKEPSVGKGAPAAKETAPAKKDFEKDTIKTTAGDLQITFIGHASLVFSFAGKEIYVDPVSKEGDYSKLPKADIILVTHAHYDHLDLDAIKTLRKEKTLIIANPASAELIPPGGVVMKNGDGMTTTGLTVEAVPAYNLVHMRVPGEPYHPKGVGNGYVITFGDKRVYVAGDTENTPEMKALKDIDYAFLPMNLPYTMTPEMVADAAKAFKPKVLYPYHFGETDTAVLVKLLEGSGIEIRIRKMK